jgi:hypothetical protein
MTGRKPLPWPLWTVALDGLGMLLLAFGLFGLLGEARFGGLTADDIKAVSIGAIVVGILLMLPFLVAVIRSVIQRQGEN